MKVLITESRLTGIVKKFLTHRYGGMAVTEHYLFGDEYKTYYFFLGVKPIFQFDPGDGELICHDDFVLPYLTDMFGLDTSESKRILMTWFSETYGYDAITIIW